MSGLVFFGRMQLLAQVHIIQDLGLSQAEVDVMVAAFWSNMKTVLEAVIARGKFSWQLMWTGQNPDDPQRNVADTCPGKETRLFAPFVCKNDHFTKTGSGQT
jgi:hypothetical protein